jgi:glycosyltransferase involved in cell wall biosynthesis
VRFDLAGREQFRAVHNLTGKFVVMYSGNHSPVHPLDTLMQAADLLKEDPTVAFCFVGGGSEWRKIKEKAEILKAESRNGESASNILCLPYQPLNQLSASLSAADAHVVVMGEAFVGLVHPCKIYNILAVGAPVLYIGPTPSHATEILSGLPGNHPWAAAHHGEAKRVAGQIRDLQKHLSGVDRTIPTSVTRSFSKAILLPRLIAEIE